MVKCEQHTYQHFKSNTLSPPDVSPVVLPVPAESPGPPLGADDDSQTATGAGIGESLVVSGVQMDGDGDGGFGAQCPQPPM